LEELLSCWFEGCFPARQRTSSFGAVKSSPEAIEEETVPQAAVTDGRGIAAELRDQGADDASPGEDHLGALGLKAHDLAALVGARRPVELDLAVDLVEGQDGSLDDLGVVRDELMLHRREVGDGAAHADERVRDRP